MTRVETTENTTNSKDSKTDTLTSEQRDEVRAQIRALLEKSNAYEALDTGERTKLAQNLVRVASFLADPAAGQVDLKETAKRSRMKSPVAMAQAGNQKPPPRPGQGGITQAAAEGFGAFVDTVDFPEFVSGLIEGVFTSIVDSSIRQMHEYSKFLEAVVMSVSDFAREHLSDNEARDYVQEKYPSIFELAVQDDQPSLSLKGDVDDESFPDFQSELEMDESFTMDQFEDEGGEAKLVESAKLQMARMRQQQLSTMVLLGINRIVVTNGSINAKVIFDVKSEESFRRDYASSYDRDTEFKHSRRSKSFWGTSSSRTDFKVTTSSSQNFESETEGRIEAKAKLTGEVKVNFKSDFFPLERIASAAELTAVEEQSKR